ncbi:MAG: hypothetical protein HQL14_02210 [Candidatus Omnitrophica bacterium]|nr:hypothetical protein [Candidatus Omnitrophota bacterium]
MIYKHTQIGWVIICSLGAAAMITFFLNVSALSVWILSILAVLFATLTVSVDAENVNIAFGPGIIRKKFRLKSIENCQISKTKCCSWGIHGWGKRWLFNVSGFDTIELKMKNGMAYYIGTDQPAQLEKAINDQRKICPNR